MLSCFFFFPFLVFFFLFTLLSLRGKGSHVFFPIEIAIMLQFDQLDSWEWMIMILFVIHFDGI